MTNSPETEHHNDTPKTEHNERSETDASPDNSLGRVILISCLSIALLGFTWYLASQPHENIARQMATQQKSAPVDKTPITKPGDTLMNKLGPFAFLSPVEVKKKAPTFSATTLSGKALQLADFQKEGKNVALVFYQGHACTVCQRQLADLQAHHSDFKDNNTELLVVSGDTQKEAAADLKKRLEESKESTNTNQSTDEEPDKKTHSSLAAPLSTKIESDLQIISDPGHVIIKKYGVLDVSKHQGAWPAVFLIDTHGVVQFTFVNAEGKRLYSEDILNAIKEQG